MKLTIDCSGVNFETELLLNVAGEFAAKRLKIPAKTHAIVYRTKFHGKEYRHTHAECQMISPRLFLVKVTNGTLKGLRKLEREETMFYMHELVHVAQMSRGILRYTRRAQKPIWKGKEIPANIAYADDPSEVQAFTLGYELADEFLLHWETARERF